MTRSRGVLVVLAALGCAATARAEVPISACDAVVPAHEVGVLQQDVTCRSYCDTDPSIVDCNGDDELCPGANGHCVSDQIRLGRGARLELNGHQVGIAYHSSGVVCGAAGDRGRCTIVGPGGLVGGKGTAVESLSMDVVLKNLFTDETDEGVVAVAGKVYLTDVVFGGREDGVRAGSTVRARRVRVGPGGIWTDGDLIVEDVTLADSSGGLIAGGTIRGRDVAVTGGKTISGRDVKLRRVVGAPSGSSTLVAVEAERRLLLDGSTVGEITSGRKPRLVRSTCTESHVVGSAGSWGVCSDD